MSNLIEKSLIIGFGVFTLIVFVSFIQPYAEIFFLNYQNDRKILENYNKIIDKIDAGIFYVLSNPEDEYIDSIDIPAFMNITISNNEIKYSLIINNDFISKLKSYPNNLVNKSYIEYIPRIYNLRISFQLNLLKVLIN